MNSTYLIISIGKLREIGDEFENLVVADVSNGGRVVEEHDFHLGPHGLLLLVVFAVHFEVGRDLYHPLDRQLKLQ